MRWQIIIFKLVELCAYDTLTTATAKGFMNIGIDLEHIKQNNAMDRKVIANALYSQKLFNDGKAEMDEALAVLTNEIEKAKELNKEYKNITDALLEEMFNKDNYKK